MVKRTTIEIDEELLERAKHALGETTTSGVVERALRRVTEDADVERTRRTAKQRTYLDRLRERIDPSVLSSEKMWR